MSTMTIEVKVPVEISKEGDVYVANCMPLNVVSQGCDEGEAIKNIKEALHFYLETCYEMGTLNDVLLEAGFNQVPTEKEIKEQNNHFIDVMLSYFAGQRTFECHA